MAIALLRVALVGARSSVELKLSSLRDAVYTQAVVHEIARLSEEGMTAAVVAESFLISAFYIYYRDFSPMIYSVAMAIMAAFISYGRFALKPF